MATKVDAIREISIVFLDAGSVQLGGDVDLSPLDAFGRFTQFKTTEPHEVIGRASGHEVLVVNKVRIDREAIARLHTLKHIAIIATGTDNVDLEAAELHGVSVSNVVGYGEGAVAHHTFALILALANRVCSYSRDVAHGDWDTSPTFALLRYPTIELTGKTLGVIGFGAIGRAVAAIAEAFGMRVVVHTRSRLKNCRYRQELLSTVLRESNVVSVHVPLTSETRGMIGPDQIALMPPGAYLINTSRGGIVDEQAILGALDSGHLAGAALDVLSQEPPRGNPLTAAQCGGRNLIVTPHIAWTPRETRQRLVDSVASNIRSWLENDDTGL